MKFKCPICGHKTETSAAMYLHFQDSDADTHAEIERQCENAGTFGWDHEINEFIEEKCPL